MSRVSGIKQDEAEFMAIIKGLIRKNLGKYILRARFIGGRQGKNLIAIAIAIIDIPTFRYGWPDDFIVSQGEGKPGDDLGPVPRDPDEDGSKEGGEGDGESRHIIVEIEEEEFLEWFGEYLKLPKIKPKGERTIYEEREKWNTIHRLGPKSTVEIRRTYKEALKRSTATGEYMPPDKVNIIIIPPDMRFRAFQKVKEPKNNAVIAFMRDISGSMGLPEVEALSVLCDYCERWLRASYRQGAFEIFYIVHDHNAEEVNRRQFLSVRENWGGTIVSTAHELFIKIIAERYPPSQWNIYPFYFSDGFNWTTDNDKYIKLMREEILPIANQYNYGQTDIQRPWLDAYRDSKADTFSLPGTIGNVLREQLKDADNIATATISGKDQQSVIEAIKKFFEKGN